MHTGLISDARIGACTRQFKVHCQTCVVFESGHRLQKIAQKKPLTNGPCSVEFLSEVEAVESEPEVFPEDA